MLHPALLLPVLLGTRTATAEAPDRSDGEVQPPPHPGCAARLEFLDPQVGWTPYVFGTSLPRAAAAHGINPHAFFPPHKLAPEPPRDATCNDETNDLEHLLLEDMIWLARSLPEPDWRIVDGYGRVLVEFDGAYAVDSRPLALSLDALDDYERGKVDPACRANRAHDCWTTFELWVYLFDWQRAHCPRPEPLEPGPPPLPPPLTAPSTDRSDRAD